MPRKRHDDDIVHLKLRFPERLRRRIAATADKNSRSINSEIMAILEEFYQKNEPTQVEKTAATAATAIWTKLKSGELTGPVVDTSRKKKS